MVNVMFWSAFLLLGLKQALWESLHGKVEYNQESRGIDDPAQLQAIAGAGCPD